MYTINQFPTYLQFTFPPARVSLLPNHDELTTRQRQLFRAGSLVRSNDLCDFALFPQAGSGRRHRRVADVLFVCGGCWRRLSIDLRYFRVGFGLISSVFCVLCRLFAIRLRLLLGDLLLLIAVDVFLEMTGQRQVSTRRSKYRLTHIITCFSGSITLGSLPVSMAVLTVSCFCT